MEVTLVVARGKVSRGELVFVPPAVLGRGREADLTVAHPMISRLHCELYEVDGLLMVRDLGSLNGTIVHDSRVVESPLRPDDCFSVGPLTFQARYQYHGNLDDVPAPKLAESEGPKPPKGDSSPDRAASPTEAPEVSAAVSEPSGISESSEGPWASAVPNEPETVKEEEAGPSAEQQDNTPHESPESEVETDTAPQHEATGEPTAPPGLKPEGPEPAEKAAEPDAESVSDETLQDFLKGLQ